MANGSTDVVVDNVCGRSKDKMINRGGAGVHARHERGSCEPSVPQGAWWVNDLARRGPRRCGEHEAHDDLDLVVPDHP